ncbi:MAG: hypothetical protein ACE5PV_17950 [Candidatus Poribacteria bacterium]
MSNRKKIAAVVTAYYPRSHADVIVTKFMNGFPTDDGLIKPRVELASIYIDQIHPNDIGQKIAAEHNAPIYQSIRQTLTLGGDELAVDGVLLIGEHGDYPHNEKGQQMYPRRYFFEQISGVFASSGRVAPVFCDKHLSYNWTDAKWMYDRAQELSVPLMAGSSLPTCWRRPFLECALDTELDEAIGIGYGGIESYGFHALETLQCMVERRKGGEVGVASVQCLEGEDVWKAADERIWSRQLAEAACAPIEKKPTGRMEEHCKNPAAFLIEYRDGFQATVLMLNGYVSDFAFAGRVGDKVQGAAFNLQSGEPYAHFSYLSLNIEEMFVTGAPQYPAERTLLTTGILDAAMNSRYRGYKRIPTPYLDIAYRSYEKAPIRPIAPNPQMSS